MALALFCLSSTLIYFSSENKQYASDVMFTLVLFLAAYPFLKQTVKPENIAQLAVIGIVSIWISHPAVFVMTGIAIATMARQIFRKE